MALLRSLGRTSDAIDALIELLEPSPTDVEAWVELSELYSLEGLQAQAIYCLEEVLLSTPFAWNVSTSRDYDGDSNGSQILDTRASGRNLARVFEIEP